MAIYTNTKLLPGAIEETIETLRQTTESVEYITDLVGSLEPTKSDVLPSPVMEAMVKLSVEVKDYRDSEDWKEVKKYITSSELVSQPLAKEWLRYNVAFYKCATLFNNVSKRFRLLSELNDARSEYLRSLTEIHKNINLNIE